MKIPDTQIKERNNNDKSIINKIQLKKIKNCSQSSNMDQSSLIFNLPKLSKKRKFIFGDLNAFGQKINMLHRFLLIKKIISQIKQFDETIKTKNDFNKSKKVSFFSFLKILKNSFYALKIEYNFKKRMKILNLHKLITIILKKNILNFITKKYKIFLQKIITIQKKYKFYKKKKLLLFIQYQKTKSSIIIQKNFRKYLIKKKYEFEIKKIKDEIQFLRKKKKFEKSMILLKKRKKAVRVIENAWLKVLEKRDNEDLEERIAKMPKDCRDLYRKFILLRKQTKILKKDLTEYHEERKKKEFAEMCLKNQTYL